MTIANLSTVKAKHIEIDRRYAWHARQRNGATKLTRTQLMTRIRLRELERIFQRRYGRFLPDDDAGRDDLVLAAHHVAHLGGDVLGHVIAWARAWAPWMSQGEARQIADRVADDPQKFTADVLAWRLRLSMVERTELKVTTIGAFDCSKADRAEERRRKNNEAKRIKRAESSNGRPRGRPRKMGTKNAGTAVDAYAVPAFSADTPSDPGTSPSPGATKPPAEAVGIPSKTVWEGADGEACEAVAGNDRQRFKTRFPTSMRLSKAAKAYALAAGFDAAKIELMFESLRDHSLAIGAYSRDWGAVWFKWVDREVDFSTERYHRARARAYAAGATL
jgi:hypothetical protein